MEMVGNKPNVILGTVHHPNHSGGNADGGSTTITNASTEFHTYSLDWSASRLSFMLMINYFTLLPIIVHCHLIKTSSLL
jgi:beta-glucanase (GH16 family)